MGAMTTQLRLFSDQSYLLDKSACVSILYPFWKGNSEKIDDPDDPKSGIFDAYVSTASSIFNVSSLDKADLAVLPTDWEPIMRLGQQASAIQFLGQMQQAKKPSISFFSGDCSHISLPINTDLIFRHSLYRSLRKVNDFAFPAWSEDFVGKYLNNQLPIRKKSTKPIVGFCGFAVKRSFKAYAKHSLYQGRKFFLKDKAGIPSYNIGHVLRLWALSKLSKSTLVESNFIQRDYPVFFTESDLCFRRRMRIEYVQNMVDSDYIFCCRGSGNYSFRFYETLCCGRIPVFIDTNCVLPYDFEVDWKKYCVWIEEDNLHQIDEKIAEFHEKLSPQEFTDLQHECRKIWKDKISPQGFYRNLYRHLSISSSKAKSLSSV